jgi:LacI family transcriptional regulator
VQRVFAAIANLGYEHNSIARSLRTDRTQIVMLMLPDITNPFWPEVARGIQDIMDGAGYSVVFANIDWSDAREQEFLRTAMRMRVDGIFINPIHVTEDQVLATRIPAVILGNRPGFRKSDMVGSDTEMAIHKALEYLLRLGHQRIGLLLGRSEVTSGFSRQRSFYEFFAKNQLETHPELVVEVTFDNHGGERGMRRLLELSEIPTAVLASNDLIALGALQVAHEMGYQVPKDVSIMGIDDIHAASLSIPALTTMRKPKYEIGQKAARLLLERMQNTNDSLAPRISKCPCQLVVRASTAPPA